MTLPGTPGHFDDGEIAFDYPVDWPVVAGNDRGATAIADVIAVFGDGLDPRICRHDDAGTPMESLSCPTAVSVPPGQFVLRVYRAYGPAGTCRGDSQANATLGSNAVRQATDGTLHQWEVRYPDNEFGQPNNVFVELRTDDQRRVSEAAGLVASFRWVSSEAFGFCRATPTPVPSLAHYQPDFGPWFDYLADWKVISGYEHWGLHGPTVYFAVGTGKFDSGCTSLPASGRGIGGVSCGQPTVSVTGDQVLVFWYEGAHVFDQGSVPTGSIPPDITVATACGQPAVESRGVGFIRWQISRAGYIEGVWGPDAIAAEDQVEALVAGCYFGPASASAS